MNLAMRLIRYSAVLVCVYVISFGVLRTHFGKIRHETDESWTILPIAPGGMARARDQSVYYGFLPLGKLDQLLSGRQYTRFEFQPTS